MIALSQGRLFRTVFRLSNGCLFSKGIGAIILVAKQQIHDETENNGTKSSHCTDNSAPIRLREVRVAIVVNNGRKGGHGGGDGCHGWEGASVEGEDSVGGGGLDENTIESVLEAGFALWERKPKE